MEQQGQIFNISFMIPESIDIMRHAFTHVNWNKKTDNEKLKILANALINKIQKPDDNRSDLIDILYNTIVGLNKDINENNLDINESYWKSQLINMNKELYGNTLSNSIDERSTLKNLANKNIQFFDNYSVKKEPGKKRDSSLNTSPDDSISDGEKPGKK